MSISTTELIETPSYNIAIAITTLCIVAYYFGTEIRRKIPASMMTDDVISSVRFAALPLMIVTGIILATVTMTVRDAFTHKQLAISEAASAAVSVDRAIFHYGRNDQTIALRAEWQQWFRDTIDFKHHTLSLAGALPLGNKLFNDMETLRVDKTDKGIQPDTKRFMVSHAREFIDAVGKLNAQTQYIVYPFTMATLTIWLCFIFNVIGITAPPGQAAAFWISSVIAGAVGSIMFLIVEFERPHVGFITLDMTPISKALEKMEQDQQVFHELYGW